MRLFLSNQHTHPFDLRAFDRTADRARAKEPLANRRRCRLQKYLESFRARTSAWVTTASALFADRFMNTDLKVDHEFYLAILTQRIRALFAAQIPKDAAAASSARGVRTNHEQILRVLVCGTDSKENDTDDDALVFDCAQFATPWTETIAVPSMSAFDEELFNAFDVREVKASTKLMIACVVSRIDIRDLLQSFAFFDVLDKLGPTALNNAEALEADAFGAFSTHKLAHSERIANDWNLLWRELGCKGDQTQILRAICAVSVLCHSNRSWQDNVHWFGDDRLKQLFNDPNAVLSHIHSHFLSRQIVGKAQPYREPQSFSFAVRGRGSRRLKLREISFDAETEENCRSVLEPNPGMSCFEFRKRAYQTWPPECRPRRAVLFAYYEQMQPIFMRNRK